MYATLLHIHAQCMLYEYNDSSVSSKYTEYEKRLEIIICREEDS